MRRLLFQSLINRPVTEPAPRLDENAIAELAARVQVAARRRLGRSLAIREVDAGSCNGCELEIHALNNAIYDLERFGIRFVASPRITSYNVCYTKLLRARRPDTPHADRSVRVSDRLHGHLGIAAPQRIRVGMADIPGDPGERNNFV